MESKTASQHDDNDNNNNNNNNNSDNNSDNRSEVTHTIERNLSRMTVADQSQVVPSVGTQSSTDSELSAVSYYSNASSSTGSSNAIDEPWNTSASSSPQHGTALSQAVSRGIGRDYERTGKKYDAARCGYSGVPTPFTSARPVSPADRAKRQTEDHLGELLTTIAARLINLERGLSTDTTYLKTAECEITNIGKMLGKGSRKGGKKSESPRSAVEWVRHLPQYMELNPNGDARRVLDELLERVEEKATNSTRVA